MRGAYNLEQGLIDNCDDDLYLTIIDQLANRENERLNYAEEEKNGERKP